MGSVGKKFALMNRVKRGKNKNVKLIDNDGKGRLNNCFKLDMGIVM